MDDGAVHVRVWAPNCERVEVVERSPSTACKRGPPAANARFLRLESDTPGYFSGRAEFLETGSLYGFRLDDDPKLYPDPASRFQPEGPHGPSQVVDPSTFHWTDEQFRGVGPRNQVIYELHVGTFTPEGTFAAAQAQLAELAALGITVIEIMPLADFPGEFGWGYDGVDLFAPYRMYGRPDALRALVNEAHRVGLGVLLDVVYNHFGPDGNYLGAFSRFYGTRKYENEWGEAINFDGEQSGPVREFFRENAAYWIDEFHFDGLRLDATQSIHDASSRHMIAEITARVRAAAAPSGRETLIVAENETQDAQLARPIERGGHGVDALWNDDFHHSAMVALTGHNPAYYSDHLGSPQELMSAVKWGFLFQGQRYQWQKQPRGTPALDLPAQSFVTYVQNHDQIANSPRGERIQFLTHPGRLRALTALMLLAPPTPMLFQGQEFASSSPFVYFADHNPELSALVRKGRKQFLAQFPALAGDDAAGVVPDPGARSTFERCKLDFSERKQHAHVYALHKDLLELRRNDPAFRQQRSDLVHGAGLGPECFLLRFFCDSGHRLLIVNLGRDFELSPVPEPLFAPPIASTWQLLFSTENPRYGGNGTAVPEQNANFNVSAQAAIVLAPRSQEP